MRPIVTPAPGRLRALLLGTAGAGFFTALGAVGALVYTDRLQMPDLPLPDEDDLIDLKRLVQPKTPPKVIYLHRGSIALAGGVDDSAQNRSSVLLSGQVRAADLPGFNGGDHAWQSLVRCVREQFSSFGVEVTDRRPEKSGYVLVAMAAAPADIGIKRRNVTGLAPFNGEVVPDPVVFAFTRNLRGDMRVACETISMEVAHTYGLDHSYLCQDVMSYLSCGPKRFIDRDAPCGESRKRRCAGGGPSQNSYRHLLGLLGGASSAMR